MAKDVLGLTAADAGYLFNPLRTHHEACAALRQLADGAGTIDRQHPAPPGQH